MQYNDHEVRISITVFKKKLKMLLAAPVNAVLNTIVHQNSFFKKAMLYILLYCIVMFNKQNKWIKQNQSINQFYFRQLSHKTHTDTRKHKERTIVTD